MGWSSYNRELAQVFPVVSRCVRGKYNRVIPLFSHVAPLIPAERHVHVRIPSAVHVDP